MKNFTSTRLFYLVIALSNHMLIHSMNNNEENQDNNITMAATSSIIKRKTEWEDVFKKANFSEILAIEYDEIGLPSTIRLNNDQTINFYALTNHTLIAHSQNYAYCIDRTKQKQLVRINKQTKSIDAYNLQGQVTIED